jgi:hypothetical protein
MIRCADLANDRASLVLRCRLCGWGTGIGGDMLVKRFGAETTLMSVVWRMRCQHDGMPPDAWIELADDQARREAIRRGISVHSPWLLARRAP